MYINSCLSLSLPILCNDDCLVRNIALDLHTPPLKLLFYNTQNKQVSIRVRSTMKRLNLCIDSMTVSSTESQSRN